MRSYMNAGQGGFRDKGSKQQCDLREGPLGLSEYLVSWIDRSHHLLIILQVLASAQHGCSKVAPRVWPISMRRLRTCRCRLPRSPSSSRRYARSCWPAQRRPVSATCAWAARRARATPCRCAEHVAEVAPTTSTLRNVSSPARVITPSLTLPAVE
jgi:hypothetical protein